MRYLITLLAFLIPFQGFAECNFSEDIKENQEGKYVYSKECHVKVGKMKTELEKRRKQVKNLEKSLELKDLALTHSKRRTKLWKNTSESLNTKVGMMQKLKDSSETLYFIGGMVFTGLAVWGAGHLEN